MILPFYINNFKKYYKDKFQYDLTHFLNNFRSGEFDSYYERDGYLYIPDSVTTNTSYKVSDTIENIGYFKVGMFYILAFVNALYEASLKNKVPDLSLRFCQMTGCPRFNSHIDGPLPPVYTLNKLLLFPLDKETNENFRQNVLKAYEFMMSEFHLFSNYSLTELTNPNFQRNCA